MVAFKSVVTKVFTTKSYSSKVDTQIIVEKVAFYRSQLGFPEKDSQEFNKMASELKEQVIKFYLTDTKDIIPWLKDFCIGTAYDDSSTERDDSTKGIEQPYKFVSWALYCVLDAMYKIALKILTAVTERQDRDNDIYILD